MQFDINKAMQDCKGIEKIEARNDTGKANKYIWLLFRNYFRDKNSTQPRMKKISKKKKKNK